MSQLLKHYMVNRDNGEYILNVPHGYVFPKLPELEIVHTLFKDNGVLYCLSTCADVLEYEITVSEEELINYQNNSNITIVSSTERTVEVSVDDNETYEVTVYDVVYTEPYVVPQTEGEGLKVITQQEWDDTITEFDNKQEEKRYNILRPIRDELLFVTDWIVIKAKETGEILSTGFKTWRQELRDLPEQSPFPTGFPTLPSEVENDYKVLALYARWSEVSSIPMINDPLSVE